MGLRPVRAGIVGPNGIGRLHADALRRIGVEVAAVAASSEERAREHAHAMGVERWYASPEALIDSDIDVVHVCTPHYLHAPIARMALDAGKHVVSEKPLAISLADALDLSERAAASGRVHAVCYVYRYYAHVGQLRSWVAEGRLGQVHLGHGTYLADELLVAPSPWALEPDKTGPWLTAADVGIHWFDLLEHVTGARIRSLAGTFRTARSAPEATTAPPDHRRQRRRHPPAGRRHVGGGGHLAGRSGPRQRHPPRAQRHHAPAPAGSRRTPTDCGGRRWPRRLATWPGPRLPGRAPAPSRRPPGTPRGSRTRSAT